MLSDPQLAVIEKLLDSLEGKVGLRLAGLQEQTRMVGMAEIRHAKDKIAVGSYGICEKCCLAIPAAYLMADPLCRVCPTCAQARRGREVRA